MRPCLARTPAGDIVIRDARGSDADRLAEIHLAAIRRGCRSHYDEAQIAAWTTAIDGPLHRAAIRDQVVMVAERRRRVIGFGEFQPRNGQIVHLFVDPAVTACGLGTRLLAALEARAVAGGVQEIRLRASLNAEGFYARRGYEPAGGPRSVTMQGIPVPCLPMRKPAAAITGGSIPEPGE
jgi:GNAT superfamily N-acetyltransferase